MAEASAHEQLMLELINKARLDPAAEAARLGIDLNKDLPAGTISPTAKAPLAFNEKLETAAALHSKDMITRDFFEHVKDGVDPSARIAAQGYTTAAGGTPRNGENISFGGQTGSITDALKLQQTLAAHDGLFKSEFHRENLMDDSFREVGLGIEHGAFLFDGTNFTASTLTTQNFGTISSNDRFITGVAINDADGDRFYDVGEARSGVSISVNDKSTATKTAGGYNLKIGNGALSVAFSNGGLPASVNVSLAASNSGVKVDLIGNDGIATSQTATLGNGAKNLFLLGVGSIDGTGNAVDNLIVGGSGANRLSGGAGNDTLQGGKGSDAAVYSGAKANYQITANADGSASVKDLVGTEGTDTLFDIESLVFSDGTQAITTSGPVDPNGPDQPNGPGPIFEEPDEPIRTIRGTNSKDTIKGKGADEHLLGRKGDDKLSGRGGDDVLDGGKGKDTLKGGNGEDTLIGGRGADKLTGGNGFDIFRYNKAVDGGDSIFDFNVAQDRIAIKASAFGLAPLTSENLIIGDGAAATNAVATVLYDTATGILSFDADGTGAGGATILATLVGGQDPGAANFMLV